MDEDDCLADDLLRYRVAFDPPLTQAQLAQRLRVSQQTVSNWERSQSSPRPAQLRRLAEVLGMSVSQVSQGCRDVTTPTGSAA